MTRPGAGAGTVSVLALSVTESLGKLSVEDLEEREGDLSNEKPLER